MTPVIQANPESTGERRDVAERRFRRWWAVYYGSFNPRRRTPPRRVEDSRFTPWIGILRI